MAMVMAVSIITTVSCNKDDDPGGNEEELITTLRLTLRETGSATTKVFEFKDKRVVEHFEDLNGFLANKKMESMRELEKK